MGCNLTQVGEMLKENDHWAVHTENGVLCITNADGIDAFLAVSGEQIVVESILFAKSQVKDVAGLNDEILKTHQVFPLTTIAISTIDGQEYYVAFGALSSQSDKESIKIEVETLFDNIEGFLDAYENYLQ